MPSAAVQRLPNADQFDSLLAGVRREFPSLEMPALMAAENYGLSIAAASAGLGACRPNCDLNTRKNEFGQKFSQASGQHSALYGQIRIPAVGKMNAWLNGAQAHASRTGQSHLARTQEAQAQYAQGVNVSMQQTAQTGRAGGVEQSSQQALQQTIAREKSGTPPPITAAPQTQPAQQPQTQPQTQQATPSGTNFTEIAAGISSILSPLATVGSGIYQSQQQAKLAKLQASQSAASYGPQAAYFPPVATGNNTLLIAGVVGGATLLLLIVVMAMR